MSVAVVSERPPIPPGTPKGDACALTFTLWTVAIFVWVSLGPTLDRVFRLYIFLVPIIGLPVLVWALSLVVALCVNAYKRRWRRALSIAIAPLIVGSSLFLLIHFGITWDFVRFEISKSSYKRQIVELPTSGSGPRLKAWNWGLAGGATGHILYVLVYDDSGQIKLPTSERSADWKSKADEAARANEFHRIIHPEAYVHSYPHYIAVTHLDENFYLVTEED